MSPIFPSVEAFATNTAACRNTVAGPTGSSATLGAGWVFVAALLPELMLAQPLTTRDPRLRLGMRVTAHNTAFSLTYPDTALGWAYRMTYDDPYFAAGIEAEYGPFALFRVRLDLSEARVYWAGGGALALFPAVGLDLFCEPPTTWRLLPYLWAGGQLTRYFGHQEEPEVIDLRFLTGFERHIRAGLGGRFMLSRRVDLFCEVQLFSEDTYPEVDASEHGAGHWLIGRFGLCQAHLGARWALAK